MMNATIVGVKEPNAWLDKSVSPPKVKGYFINGVFADGKEFSAFGDEGNKDAITKQLRDLIGKPGDYEGEDRTTPSGSTQFKLKSWPGKAASGGGGFRGGGSRGWSEAYSQSKEAHEVTQRSIQRACALERAVQVSVANGGPNSPEGILDIANKFASWLAGGVPSTSAEYDKFIAWFKDEVEAQGVINKPTLWKAAMTFAHAAGYDHEKLKVCTSTSVFDSIKEKLSPATKPSNGSKQPNAYQPAGADGGEFPF